ncbi:MAG: cupin domain-containing protein, partial [Planctomycetota bacterium]
GGLAGAQVCRPAGALETGVYRHDAEFLFLFVLQGATTLDCEGRGAQRLGAGDSFVVPAAMQYALADCSEDVELLEVTLPAAFETVSHADDTCRVESL